MIETDSDLMNVGSGLPDPAAFADRLFAAAQPGAVFGEPVRAGEYTVITASEVAAGGGFGGGRGLGPAAAPGENRSMAVGGGGIGGGGGSTGRPVAVIIIGPDGVRVQPVVDPTKIALTVITAWGAVAGSLFRMRRFQRH